jgi:hypothetical protein
LPNIDAVKRGDPFLAPGAILVARPERIDLAALAFLLDPFPE